MTFPDLSIYTAAEIAEFRDAIKAERLRRLTGESVQSGSKNGKSYTLTQMSDAALSAFESAIAQRQNKRTTQRRRIDFNRRAH